MTRLYETYGFYDGLNESEKVYIRRWEDEALPLLSDYVHQLNEAVLTKDQVLDMFNRIETTTKTGFFKNKTALGHAVDLIRLPSALADKLGALLQNSKPIKKFDELFERCKGKLRHAIGEDTKLVAVVDGMGAFARKHPIVQGFVIGLLSLIASAVTGPMALPIVASLLRMGNELLKGEKLSTATGRSIKTGMLSAIAGWSAKQIASMFLNTTFDLNSIPDYEQLRSMRMVYDMNGNTVFSINAMVTDEMAPKVQKLWDIAKTAADARDFERAAEAYSSLKEILEDPEYLDAIKTIADNNDALFYQARIDSADAAKTLDAIVSGVESAVAGITSAKNSKEDLSESITYKIEVTTGNVQNTVDIVAVSEQEALRTAVENAKSSGADNATATVLSESYSKNKLPKTEQEWITAVSKKPELIRYHPSPSEAVQVAAVSQNGYAISYIKNPSEAVQLAAMKQNGWAVQCIKNPSEAVQLAAVQVLGGVIYYIKNPSEAVQLAAVKNYSGVIEYIKHPSEAVQLAAVKQDGGAISYIKNPSEAVQVAAVQQDGGAIYYIKNPSEAVQLAAVKQDSRSISNIENPSWHNREIKKTMIACLITQIKNRDVEDANRTINNLLDRNCPWPEIKVIADRLKTTNLNEGLADNLKAPISKWVKNLTNRITANKLTKAWERAGSPTDTDELAAFLKSQGIANTVLDEYIPADEKAADTATVTFNTGDAAFDDHLTKLLANSGKEAVVKALQSYRDKLTNDGEYAKLKGEMRRMAKTPGSKKLPKAIGDRFKQELQNNLANLARGDKNSGVEAANKIMKYAKAGYDVTAQINAWLATAAKEKNGPAKPGYTGPKVTGQTTPFKKWANRKPYRESIGYLNTQDFAVLSEMLQTHDLTWGDVGLLVESNSHGTLIERIS